jgi:hypothetical protein
VTIPCHEIYLEFFNAIYFGQSERDTTIATTGLYMPAVNIDRAAAPGKSGGPFFIFPAMQFPNKARPQQRDGRHFSVTSRPIPKAKRPRLGYSPGQPDRHQNTAAACRLRSLTTPASAPERQSPCATKTP